MKSKKREVNIRRRLRDKELLEYLNNHNFQNANTTKKLKKLMIETGYSIPFKEITAKDIYVFYRTFLDAEKKYSSKNLNNMQAKTVTKLIKSNNENSVFGIDTIKAPKADEQTYIYLIRDGKTGNIKIGISNNVKKRMTSIINEYYVWPVELIFCLPFPSRNDAESMESYLHKKYSRYRLFSYSTQKGNTSKEWFDLNKNHVEEIKNILNKNYEARNNPSKKRNFDSVDLLAYGFLICVAIALLPFTIMFLIFWLIMRIYIKKR
jgi:predicted GIY-YIG superfamily endonuclease